MSAWLTGSRDLGARSPGGEVGSTWRDEDADEASEEKELNFSVPHFLQRLVSSQRIWPYPFRCWLPEVGKREVLAGK